MTIFIDYIFIENILYNLVIILQTAFLARIKIKKLRACLASLVGSGYVCVMILLNLNILNYFWCKLILSFVVLYVAFVPKNIGMCLKLIGIYYLATIINVGGCIVVNQMLIKGENTTISVKIVVYTISLVLTYIYTKLFWKIYKNKLGNISLIQQVTINIQNKKYSYNGFLDTGNTVWNYELGVPVVFAEYLNEEQKNIVEKIPKYSVTVSTISKQSQEKVVLVRKARIGTCFADIGVVFVDKKLNKNDRYNMILNYELFEEKLGGIHI